MDDKKNDKEYFEKCIQSHEVHCGEFKTLGDMGFVSAGTNGIYIDFTALLEKGQVVILIKYCPFCGQKLPKHS